MKLRLSFKKNGYRWRFFRAGGLDQVRIRSGQDIARLPELDQKLWVILSCPTRGVRFDARTLDLIDTDKDGRIRAPELLQAIRWTVAHLKDPDLLLQDSPDLALASIQDANPSGARLLAGAKRILANLGKPDADRITLTDIADRAAIFAQTRFNGDAIVPPQVTDDPEIRQVIEAILACLGGDPDRSGKPGVSQAKLDAFFKEANAFSDWWAQAEQNPAVLPLGPATAQADAALNTVRAKADDFFTRCRLAAFDSRAGDRLNRSEADFAELAPHPLTLASDAIAVFPLARVGSGRALPLSGAVNPYWAAALTSLRDQTAGPLLGGSTDELTEEQWLALKAKLAPYEAWMAAKAGVAVEPLGLERIRTILAGPARDAIGKLIRQDAELNVENDQINDVEKLIRYHRHLNRLLHNFVNFSDFYDETYEEIFRMGRLYIDGRACDLCFHVEDMAKHAVLAAPSKIYLAYCEITHPSTRRKRTICAAFTAGFAESLWVGRNGIFYDRDGEDWEAVIVKIVESAISIKEAFWSPWKKIATMVGDQINKLLSDKQDAALKAASTGVDQTLKTAAAPPPAAPQPGAPPPAGAAASPAAVKMEGAALASSVAAIGIAVGLLGSAVGGLLSVISGLPLWKTLLGVAGVILAVSGPSVILTYFRLRARDLAPILNACGWAVNGRIKMTMKLSREFTGEAELPSNADRDLLDPFADSHLTRNLALTAVLLLGVLLLYWRLGWLNDWLPAAMEPKPRAPLGAPAAPAP